MLPVIVVCTFLATLVLLALSPPLAARLGLVDQPGARKQHQGSVPLTGGLCMFSVLLVTLLLLDPGRYTALTAATLLLIAVGLWDDLHELNTRARFLAQIMATVIMIFAGGVSLHELGDLLGTGTVALNLSSLPFTVFCVVGVINAINMADGLDGLAGGLALQMTLWLTLLAALSSHHGGEMPALLCLAAVVVGFLCFNLRHPWRARAAVFMGDAGSMALGFTLCWFLVGLSQDATRAFAPMTAVWIMGLPLLDTVAIMVRRAVNGRSPTAADRQHLHHLLLALGLSHERTVLTLWLAAFALSGIGVAAEFLGVPEYVMFYTFWTLFFIYYYTTARLWRRLEGSTTVLTSTP